MWFCLWKIHELLIRFNWFEESGKLNLKEDSYTTSCSFILEQTMSEIDAEIEQWSIATFHWIELSTASCQPALNTNWNHVAIFRNSFLESIITLTKANCWYILEMNDFIYHSSYASQWCKNVHYAKIHLNLTLDQYQLSNSKSIMIGLAAWHPSLIRITSQAYLVLTMITEVVMIQKNF